MPSRRGLLASCGAAAAALAGCTTLSDAPVAWNHAFDGRVIAPPVLASGVVVVPLEEESVAVGGGEVRWRSPATGSTAPAATLGGERVVFGTDGRQPYHSVDVASGDREWALDRELFGLASPAGESVLVAGDRSRLVGAFAASGGVTWSRSFQLSADDGTTPVGALSSARVVDGTAYLRGGPGYLALDADTGDTVWARGREQGVRFEVGRRNMSLAPAVGDGAAYFWTTDEGRDALGAAQVLARERSDGRVRWRHPTTGAAAAPAYADGLDLVIAADESGAVAALQPGDGTVEWSVDLDGLVAYTRPVAHRGTVYVPVGGDQDHLVALEAATGERLFSLSTGHSLHPVAAGDRVYAVGYRGLYALET